MRVATAGRVVVAAFLAVGLASLSVGSEAATGSSSAVSKKKTVERVHLDGGANDVVDKKTVSLRVSKTENLRGREEIQVGWSGAHPSGGLYADQNSADAAQAEYPMVLLECRGVDSTAVATSKRVRPESCWTQAASERVVQSGTAGPNSGQSAGAFPSWRLDRYATAAQRAAQVGVPSPRPSGCGTAAAEYWVPTVGAGGKSFANGPVGCAGLAPESDIAAGDLALPSNETFGVTGADGTGQATFDIFTAQENATLGCSASVPCSLVAIPIMGISCDAAAASLPPADQPPAAKAAAVKATCEADGHFAPGALVGAGQGGAQDVAVSGQLWWAASNWRNRITVPLTFAQSDSVCDVVSASNSVDVYGSELMSQATTQWAPHFCLDPKLFRFKHVRTSEPPARGQLEAGTVEAVFTSDPGGTVYSKPVVNAPVGLTGFAVTYTIDDAKRGEYTKLKLTPRLLAKLLTESYPARIDQQTEYQALSNNPLNIAADPEFQALNPGLPKDVGASESAATLLALSNQSDVIRALTAYIDADPAARAWIDGKPDPWGMVVNPNYEGMVLPVTSWPLLDTFQPANWYASNQNECLKDNPVAYLPLVASPLPSLADIAQSMQFSIVNVQTRCFRPVPDSSDGEKLVRLGRQTAGFRFMIGITALADARRYQLDTAALQTHVDTNATAKFTNASGRTFVTPSDASLRAAAGLLTNDPAAGTWRLSYDALRTSATGVGAYPGTVLVSAAVPTSGLPKDDAADFATLLRFAAGAGQQAGDGNGQLPAGYLPMTKANGLGAQAAYTKRAADAVAAQQGSLPSTTGAGSSSDDPDGSGSGDPGSGGANPGGPSGDVPGAVPGASTAAGAGGVTSPSVVAVGVTRTPSGGAAALVLPLALLVAVVAGVSAPVIREVARRRAAP